MFDPKPHRYFLIFCHSHLLIVYSEENTMSWINNQPADPKAQLAEQVEVARTPNNQSIGSLKPYRGTTLQQDLLAGEMNNEDWRRQ